MIKIGLIKEGKVPPDRRVPLTPEQAKFLTDSYPEFEVCVQSSDLRCFADDEYHQLGLPVQDSVADCDILLGVKEVPIPQLVADKTYMFFSHTIKEQPYNRNLLRAILEKNITLIDYEVLTDKNGQRIVAFGRYAGIVGAYNGLLTYGKKFGLFELRRAYQCFDLADLRNEFVKIKLPPIKIALTGSGRVAHGAMEVLDGAGIRKVTPDEYLHKEFAEAVYVQLQSQDYNKHKEGKPFSKEEFHRHPERYKGGFLRYAYHTDLLIAGAYWDPRAPVLFTLDDLNDPRFRIKVIADITCDIEGSIPTTIRPTTIADSVYDYDPHKRGEAPAYSARENITVMAIDNLPNELPRDASHDFGQELINRVLPLFLSGDEEQVLERATITRQGKLTEPYAYLAGYAGLQ